MQHEVRSIPPAPRRARLRPMLGHRWPLLVAGGIMVFLGSLIAWAMFLQSSGTFSWGERLDNGRTEVIEGVVQEMRPSIQFNDRNWDDVHYLAPWFPEGSGSEHQGIDLYGCTFVPAGSYMIGDIVPIEVLLESPNIHRVQGGVLRADRRWLYAQFWIVVMVIPGALILLTWLTSMFQLRQVLVHGDVSVGRVVEVRPVKYVLPEMLTVTYEFRDHRARMRKNRHWVRARGALGNRLQNWTVKSRDEALPVLHDRRFPHWNRLLLPRDFLLTPLTRIQGLPTGD
ncbi:MAG: hypothetical protein ACI89X_003655 [Planctomycetota bacterium]|jgi:hypothetical protein